VVLELVGFDGDPRCQAVLERASETTHVMVLGRAGLLEAERRPERIGC
jgi:hypothetical protein